MPGNRLSFAVFVSGEPDGTRLAGELFQFRDGLFLFTVDFINSFKVVVGINRRLTLVGFFCDTTNVADAGFNGKI